MFRLTIYSLYFHVNVFISFINFLHKKIDYMFRNKSSSRVTKTLFPLLLGRSIFFSSSSSPSSYVTQCHGYYVFTYQNAFTQYTDVFRLRMLKYADSQKESKENEKIEIRFAIPMQREAHKYLGNV